MDAPPGLCAFPVESCMLLWVGTIEGGPGTRYEGLTYRISISFPDEYPFDPPTVKFTTPCFHPNVHPEGDICLDILQDNWLPANDVRTLLLSIQRLLSDPNLASPLDPAAAAFWTETHHVRFSARGLRFLMSDAASSSDL